MSDGGVVVSGRGLPDALAVVPASAVRAAGEVVPTAGSWRRDGETAIFVPRFPLAPGTPFALLGRVDAREPWRQLAAFDVPDAVPTASTVVVSIDPDVSLVPANLLRFAVTFSSPMDEGSAAGNIRLLDERGRELPGALLDMPPELWDRERRRLTVLLEPGRIKRGLQPNVLAGAPLREGDTVTLVVGTGIRDADGSPIAVAALREFRVGAAIRSRVDPSLWKVRWPDDDGGPIEVTFDRPLDRMLVRRYLSVVDEDDHPVGGRATLGMDAREWAFTPSAPSEPGDAQPQRADRRLRVDARLEDLAGNSVRRVFDRDLERADDDSIDEPFVFLGRRGPA